jgi:hypothetical protein
MIKLNIISTALKKEIKTKILYRAINKLIVITFITIVLYALSFFSAKIILQLHFNKLVNENISLNRGPENYVITVKEINTQIENIEKIQNEAIYWSYLLEKINNLVNNGVSITKLQNIKEKNIFYLKGQADTRDSLLAFKKDLEKSLMFKNVELPIQSLLSKTNINFEISLSLVNYDFK